MSNDEMSPASKELDEWVVKIKDGVERAIDGNREKRPSIFGKWKCWDDFGASFIPETQKWVFLACMTHCFGLDVCSYLEYMQDKVDLAWSYYRRVDDQFRTAENSKRFIEHLLVNSCFLIFSMILLLKSEEPESEEEQLKNKLLDIFNEKKPKGLDVQSMIDFIMEDPMRAKGHLLTMNYQIPWFVVQAVYTELSNLSNMLKLSDTLPESTLSEGTLSETNPEGTLSDTHPEGTLSDTLSDIHPEGTLSDIHKIAYLFCHGFQPTPLKKIVEGGTLPEGYFKHLLHIFHWSRIPDGKYLRPLKPTKWIGRFHIPSATNLQLSQIIFIKEEDHSIDVFDPDRNKLSNCFHKGEMKLTPWHFWQYSIKLYGSLLKFEQWYGDQCGFRFSSYVTCMASLIKTEEDVKVLRTSEIIPNTSFDDKAILRHVQELRTLIHDNLPMPEELDNLEENVRAHRKKSAYRVYGEFKQRYCSNTWIIISVIAAILLFVFTFLQTVYSMLSYYNQ